MSAVKNNSEHFNSKLREMGFVNLGFYGIGNVYVVSTKEVKSLDEMKGIKIWAWEGDKIIEAMMESLGLVSVPLALPDVLSSLSTGMIDAAYAPPLAVLALQWQNKIKYLIDFPTAYTIGALLIHEKRWKKISKEHRALVRKIATKHINSANELAILDNQKSLEKLKSLGVKFISFDKKDTDKAEEMRKSVINKLENKVLPKSIIQKIEGSR